MYGAGMVLRVEFLSWWRLREFRIVSSEGESYAGRCEPSLEFSVECGGPNRITCRRHRRRGKVTLVIRKDGAQIATIRPGPIRDKLLVGETSYRVPSFCHPGVPELGIALARLPMILGGRHIARLSGPEHLDIVLALLSYMHARSLYVMG